MQTTALILANPPPGQKGYPFLQSRNKTDAPRATLVVCPVSVISNWSIQLKKFVAKEARLKVEIYHGPNRAEVLEKVVENKIDVLLTSFDTLASDYKIVEEKPVNVQFEGGPAESTTPKKETALKKCSKHVVDLATPTPRKARHKRSRYSEDSDDDEAVSKAGSEFGSEFGSDEESDEDSEGGFEESVYDEEESDFLDDSNSWGSEVEVDSIFEVPFHRVVVSILLVHIICSCTSFSVSNASSRRSSSLTRPTPSGTRKPGILVRQML